MAGLTDFAENAVANALYRGVTFPVLSTIYWALFTTLPDGELGTGGTEVTATGYARAATTCNTTNFKDPSTATQGQVQNLTKIVWPVQNAAIPTPVLGFGWYDASSGGNLWLVIDSADVSVDALGQPYIDISGFTQTFD
jgi:hypothetical protein